MYDQLCLYLHFSDVQKHFASVNVPSHESFFYRLGVRKKKKDLVQKHILPHAATAEREALFVFVVFSQYLTIFFTPRKHRDSQSRTPAHTVCCSYTGDTSSFFSQRVFSICVTMHVQTHTVNLSFSVSLVPVSVARCGSSTAPTDGKSMGLLLQEP